jgi:hypothetical protein
LQPLPLSARQLGHMSNRLMTACYLAVTLMVRIAALMMMGVGVICSGA